MMNLCAFLLAASLQSAPSQLDLHPQGQDLYLAVPDLQALIGALESTPGPRFMASDGMLKLLALLPGEEWNQQGSAAESLASSLGMPQLASQLPSIKGVTISVGQSDEGRQALAMFQLADAERAQALLSILTEQLGAQVSDQGLKLQGVTSELWRRPAGEGFDLPVWLLSSGKRLLIGAGASSPERALLLIKSKTDRASLENSSGAQERIQASGLAEIPSAPESVAIWLVHQSDPLELLASWDAQYGILQGQLDGFFGLSWCGQQGVARLEVSPQGYALDCFSEGSVSEQIALDPALISSVSEKAMLVMACRTGLGEQSERLVSLMGLLGIEPQNLESIDEGWASLFNLLEDDAIVYSNPMNSTSPPKCYLSIALKPGEDQAAKALKACSDLFTSVSGLPVAQREYRVRNRLTKERHAFPVHTLVMPENPNRGLLTPSISPSFTVAKGRLLLCPRSMYLKNELKRLYDGKALTPESQGPLGVRTLSLPEGAQSLVFFDWADQIGTLFSMFPMLALALPSLPFGTDDLPSAAEVRQAFPPVFGYAVPVEGGLMHHYQSAVGIDLLIGGLRLMNNLKGSMGELGSLLPR